MGGASLWKRVFVAYFLVDQSYGVAIRKYEETPSLPLSEKLAYFFGAVTPICPMWYLFSYIGAVAGTAIPPEYALDFAVPITFISLVAPSLRSLPHLCAAFVSVVVALLLAWLPYNLWLMVAGVLAMMTGAQVEQWLEARK